MVKPTRGMLGRIMGSKSNIRNVTLITPDDHVKSTITSSLVEASETIAGGNALDITGIGISDKSLYYEMSKELIESFKDEKDGNGFILNLIDPPDHGDISSEERTSFCIPDGAVVVVDCFEGVSMETENLLRCAVIERVRPVLTVDMTETCFLQLQGDGEKAYQAISSVIADANAILNTCEDSLLGDVKIHPEEGTAAFSCSSYGWAFTLSRFAKRYAQELGLDEKKMMDKLWGDHFFDTVTKEWTCRNMGSQTCKRGFVLFCYEPIMKVVSYCLNDHKARLWSFLKREDVMLSADEKELRRESLLKCVMKTWLPVSTALLELMIFHLPSPVKAQEYRVDNLYRGPLNDKYATCIRNCDSSGLLMLYVSKVIPTSDNNKLFAFGRVFSGQVACGMKVRIMGPNYIPGKKKDLHVEGAQFTVIWMGMNQESVDSVPCGNTVGLVGLNKCVENATLTSMKEVDACPIRATKISMSDAVSITNQDDVTLEAIGGSRGEEFRLPYSIYDSLYLHQREAIIWLWSIHCKDTGAILADDMGLGKTREVATFLAGLLHSKIIRTAMVIAPSMLVNQWEGELHMVNVDSKKFVRGTDISALNCVIQRGGVLLTSYDIFRIHLSNHGDDWDYVFLDEGHCIKNPKTKRSKALECIVSNHKIVVSGTPVQNNLKEFHALMAFCHPTLLGGEEDFKKIFIIPIDRGKHRDAGPNLKIRSSAAVKALKELIEPFVLRRTKQLLKDQGRLKSDKQEIVVWVRLSNFQERLYVELVQDDTLKIQGTAFSALRIAEDICNHPQLLLSDCAIESDTYYRAFKDRLLSIYNSEVELHDEHHMSGKLSFLTYLVPKLLEERHKVLIFAQSPRTLQIIKRTLATITEEGTLIYMDGTTMSHERTNLIGEFQASTSSPPLVFLMTSKVGGLGVTLTKASRVIIFDPSMNPSDDSQSVDRAYRIGQKKDVFVYRLITCATVEEHTYRQQILKGEISCAVLGEQRKRSINKQERNVLSIPPRGFGYCQTLDELADTYGYEGFNRAFKADLDLAENNDHVIGITNHTLLFTIKDDFLLSNGPYDRLSAQDFIEDKRLEKGKGRKVENLMASSQVNYGLSSMKIQLTRNIVRCLVSNNFSEKKKIERTSGATVSFPDKATPQKEYQQVLLIGSDLEVRKSQKLLDDFVKKEESKKRLVIYVPRDRVCFIVGKKGVKINEIREQSGAKIEINHTQLNIDHPGEQAIVISGSEGEIEIARTKILEIAQKENRVSQPLLKQY